MATSTVVVDSDLDFVTHNDMHSETASEPEVVDRPLIEDIEEGNEAFNQSDLEHSDLDEDARETEHEMLQYVLQESRRAQNQTHNSNTETEPLERQPSNQDSTQTEQSGAPLEQTRTTSSSRSNDGFTPFGDSIAARPSSQSSTGQASNINWDAETVYSETNGEEDDFVDSALARALTLSALNEGLPTKTPRIPAAAQSNSTFLDRYTQRGIETYTTSRRRHHHHHTQQDRSHRPSDTDRYRPWQDLSQSERREREAKFGPFHEDDLQDEGRRSLATSSSVKCAPASPHTCMAIDSQSRSELVKILDTSAFAKLLAALDYPDAFCLALTCRAVHTAIQDEVLDRKKVEYARAVKQATYLSGWHRGDDTPAGSSSEGAQRSNQAPIQWEWYGQKAFCDACLFLLDRSYFTPFGQRDLLPPGPNPLELRRTSSNSDRRSISDATAHAAKLRQWRQRQVDTIRVCRQCVEFRVRAQRAAEAAAEDGTGAEKWQKITMGTELEDVKLDDKGDGIGLPSPVWRPSVRRTVVGLSGNGELWYRERM